MAVNNIVLQPSMDTASKMADMQSPIMAAWTWLADLEIQRIYEPGFLH